jgi:hypothetical protein
MAKPWPCARVLGHDSGYASLGTELAPTATPLAHAQTPDVSEPRRFLTTGRRRGWDGLGGSRTSLCLAEHGVHGIKAFTSTSANR